MSATRRPRRQESGISIRQVLGLHKRLEVRDFLRCQNVRGRPVRIRLHRLLRPDTKQRGVQDVQRKFLHQRFPVRSRHRHACQRAPCPADPAPDPRPRALLRAPAPALLFDTACPPHASPLLQPRHRAALAHPAATRVLNHSACPRWRCFHRLICQPGTARGPARAPETATRASRMAAHARAGISNKFTTDASRITAGNATTGEWCLCSSACALSY